MVTVVTAAFFGNERPIKCICKQPPFEGVEYKLITNRPQRARDRPPWDVTTLKLTGDLRLKAREIKTKIHNFFPHSDYWLWLDADMQVQVDPKILVEKYLARHDLVAMPHPVRYNYHEEAQECKASPRCHGTQGIKGINKAVNFYLKEGHMPVGLYETGVLLRRNTSKIREFNEIWWNQIVTNSIRDQISLTYAAWKTGVAINTFPGNNRQREKSPPRHKYIPYWTEVMRKWK